jgi:asparagine synthase (glutamine-hydrolysing)
MPIQRWINQELREYMRDILSGQRARERGYFDRGYVDLLLDEHSRNRRDHATKLWALFMLELWHRTFYDFAGFQPAAAIGTLEVVLKT